MAESERSNQTRIMESPVEAAESSASEMPQGPPPPASPPAESSRPPLAAVAQPSAPPRDAFAPPLTTERHTATRRTLPTLIVAVVALADAAGLILYFAAR